MRHEFQLCTNISADRFDHDLPQLLVEFYLFYFIVHRSNCVVYREKLDCADTEEIGRAHV